MLSTLVVAVVWLFVSVEWVLGASVVVSDTELVLSDCCVVVVWLVTSVECVSGVSVDSTEVSVVVVIETELVVSLGPCVVFWFGAFVKMVLVASVDSVEVCVVVSGAELFVLLGYCDVVVVGASVDAVLSTPSLVEFVPLLGFSVVIVSDVVVVSVSSVVFTVVVGIATLVEVVSDVIVFVVLCVSGVGVVSELFVVVVIVVVDKLVVDCDVSPGCVVVVSTVDPLCNVVVAAVVSFPEGDVASLEDCVDEASVTFSVVCVNWGDVVVIDASVVEDKLDTSTTADIITDTCTQMYSYLVNLVFKDILKDTQYSFRMSQLKYPFLAGKKEITRR